MQCGERRAATRRHVTGYRNRRCHVNAAMNGNHLISPVSGSAVPNMTRGTLGDEQFLGLIGRSLHRFFAIGFRYHEFKDGCNWMDIERDIYVAGV